MGIFVYELRNGRENDALDGGGKALGVVALLLAAANMRTGIASMGPLMAAFQAVWGVGAGAA
ncbi:hypothetical protein AB1399_00365, partial [Hydrogenibacillus schlegelii]|uniref:hypothetical protein n=1 Tax=Hydrogenibacillus schlegelii TaxID=1484 RepID=UPI0034A05314